MNASVGGIVLGFACWCYFLAPSARGNVSEDDFKEADAELNTIYQALRQRLTKQQKEQLLKSQRDWLARRDKQVLAKPSANKWSTLLSETQNRLISLKRYLPDSVLEAISRAEMEAELEKLEEVLTPDQVQFLENDQALWLGAEQSHSVWQFSSRADQLKQWRLAEIARLAVADLVQKTWPDEPSNWPSHDRGKMLALLSGESLFATEKTRTLNNDYEPKKQNLAAFLRGAGSFPREAAPSIKPVESKDYPRILADLSKHWTAIPGPSSSPPAPAVFLQHRPSSAILSEATTESVVARTYEGDPCIYLFDPVSGVLVEKFNPSHIDSYRTFGSTPSHLQLSSDGRLLAFCISRQDTAPPTVFCYNLEENVLLSSGAHTPVIVRTKDGKTSLAERTDELAEAQSSLFEGSQRLLDELKISNPTRNAWLDLIRQQAEVSKALDAPLPTSDLAEELSTQDELAATTNTGLHTDDYEREGDAIIVQSTASYGSRWIVSHIRPVRNGSPTQIDLWTLRTIGTRSPTASTRREERSGRPLSLRRSTDFWQNVLNAEQTDATGNKMAETDRFVSVDGKLALRCVDSTHAYAGGRTFIVDDLRKQSPILLPYCSDAGSAGEPNLYPGSQPTAMRPLPLPFPLKNYAFERHHYYDKITSTLWLSGEDFGLSAVAPETLSYDNYPQVTAFDAFAVAGRLVLGIPNVNEAKFELWSLDHGKISDVFANENGDLTVVLPSGEYAGRDFRHVAFKNCFTGYPFEQFDLRLNRPDIVLERLGAPSEAVSIARQLREKRLKRMGVTEEMLKPDFHVPELEIVGDVPGTTDAEEINVVIKANDSKYPLERLKVFVNNVPVNGVDGESLRDQNSQSLERTIPIKLAAGRNKIQVSVLNNAGAESLYANAEVNCTAQRPKPTLYAVGLGVSDYAKPEWNLQYAAKDAKDVLERLKTRSSLSYGEVKELLLTDRQVTKESLGQIKDFLKDATIDDTVLMFVAGHGLLDSQYDYYFGTNDIDFNNPAEKGIAFEEFDDLLAGLPCLKKSLLIDTCHAGELDEEEKTLLASAGGTAAPLPTGNGIAMRSIGTRGMNVKAIEGARGASEWYDRLQGLFVDLRRGSGSTILSSSAGAEYALESSEQQNGLFTYAVLEALDGKKEADTNKDGSVQMSELVEYVKKRVAELTNNKQTPNTRRVNLEGDFTVAKTE
jgi:hypothetical protein